MIHHRIDAAQQNAVSHSKSPEGQEATPSEHEPREAFPYQPPNEPLQKQYRHVFGQTQALKVPWPKLLFDKLLAVFFLLLSAPIIVLLLLANAIEGMLIAENKGPLFFYYYAVSRGKVFKKWKIRIIKESYIDKELQKQGDWHAFQNEWDPKARTITGRFVKKFYLDEIPQFFLILKGDMSFVGPRPLAVHHYQRDLQQGNVTRKLVRGGLLGYGHIRKGTPDFGKAHFEYEYVHRYLQSSSFGLLLTDLYVIRRGIAVVLKGGGH